MIRISRVAAMALACLSGAASADDIPQVLSAAGGRFVFGQISTYHSDQYLLDTQTGRLWKIVCFQDPPPVGAAICSDRRLVQLPFVTPAGGQDLYAPDSHPGATIPSRPSK